MIQPAKILNIYFATHKSCNLDCSYCYVPKYNKNNRREDDQKILTALDRFFDTVENENRKIGIFCLHGSEPSLVSPETLGKIINRVNRHWAENDVTGKTVAIQSNGLRFTSEYLDTVETEIGDLKKIRLGFSIDFPKSAHDKYRNNSFDKVYANYDAARKRGMKVSILSVVTRETMNCLDEFADGISRELERYRKAGNPYKVKIKLATGEMALTDDETDRFGQFLIKKNLAGLMQILTPGYCLQSGNECLWYEFDIDGKVYACNKTYNKAGIFADWHKESFDEIEKKRATLFADTIEHPDCGKCEYEFFCNSGCPTDRIKTGPDAGKAHECRIIKAVMKDLEKRNIHLQKFYNNN